MTAGTPSVTETNSTNRVHGLNDSYRPHRASRSALKLHGRQHKAEAVNVALDQRIHDQVLNDVDARLGAAMLVHPHDDLGMLGARQHLKRHVVGANRDPVLRRRRMLPADVGLVWM
jgi:hypothetical protein